MNAAPVSVAVLGAGSWGTHLIRNFAALGTLAWVCDLREDRCREVAARYPQVRWSVSPQQVWDSPVQAVAVATPAGTHHELARETLRAGKDLLCEKPLALTCAQAAELVHLAERSGRILMVGHVLEYHPGIVRLRDLVRDGELGETYYLYSNRLSLGKVRREENILWSFAPHDIAVILRLTGAMPVEVSACGGAYLQRGVPDVTVTQLAFANGARGHIHVSWLHPFKEQRLVVVGSRRMAVFDDVAGELVLYDRRVDCNGLEPSAVHGAGQRVIYSDEEPLRIECAAFLQAVLRRQPPLADGRSALQVLSVLEAAQQSLARRGEAVSPGSVGVGV